ncbi:MAG TPA: hypothetical protein VF526_04875 [Solirubrobacteraceae bacterium]|jgi:hypothetical protein
MRLSRPFRTILALALALVLSLASCGSDKDETAIRDGLTKALTSTSPAACSSGYTQAFLDQGTYGSSTVAASFRRFCRSNIKELAADAVNVSEVRIDGDNAEADFSASGGQYAFKNATVTLRKSDGQWRLDRLKALELKRPEYDKQQERLAILQAGGLSRKEAACYRRRIERVSDKRLSNAIVASDPSYLADPLLVCVIRPTLLKGGFTSAQTGCILRRVRGSSARTFVRLTLAGTKSAERSIKGRFRRAAKTCSSV